MRLPSLSALLFALLGVNLAYSDVGDINNDGEVNETDTGLLVGHLSGAFLLVGDDLIMSDVNADGLSDGSDVVSLGLIRDVPVLTSIVSTSPFDGEAAVALTRETVIRFNQPLDPQTVSTDSFSVQIGAEVLPLTVHLSRDAKTVTLFYGDQGRIDPLPGNSRVVIRADGSVLRDTNGELVDVDNDGTAGGMLQLDFETLAISEVPGTAICGRVFASEFVNDEFVNLPLQGAKVSVDGADVRDIPPVLTDANGNFRLEPVPAGKFFVHIDGKGGFNLPPGDAYYPNVGKPFTGIAGREVNVGDIFLPLVHEGALKEVSATETTLITFVDSVLEDYPELEGTTLMVPPGIFDGFFQSGNRVGLGAVDPQRLPGPLPPGFTPPIVITVQTDGGGNFNEPLPVCLPNLPDPVTGEVGKPGDKAALYSFDHDVGAFAVVGTMRVSDDGKFLCSDPGQGILAPGWHFADPGCQIGGRPRRFCIENDDTLQEIVDSTQKSLNLMKQSVSAGGEAVSVLAGAKVVARSAPIGFLGGTAIAFNLVDCIGGDSFSCLGVVITAGALIPNPASPAFAVLGTLHTLASAEMAIRDWNENVKKVAGQSSPCIVINRDGRGVTEAEELDSLIDSIFTKLPTHIALMEEMQELSGDIHEILDTADEDLPNLGFSPMEVAAHQQVLNRYIEITETLDEQGFVLYDVLDYIALAQEIVSRATSDPGGREDGEYFLAFDVNGLVVRQHVTGSGAFNRPAGPDSYADIRIYNATKKLYGAWAGITPSSGARLEIGDIPLIPIDPTDTDNDGLPDLAEDVIGTFPDNPDSDGDGILDGLEVEQGSDPLDGLNIGVGIIASHDIPRAFQIDVQDDLAVVDVAAPTLETSIAVFNIFSGMSPMLVGEYPTPDLTLDVRVRGDEIIYSTYDGITILDISNLPNISEKLFIPFEAFGPFEVSSDVIYVAGENSNAVFDRATGALLSESSTLRTATDMDMLGDYLYVMDNELKVYDITQRNLNPLDPVASDFAFSRYFQVGESVARAIASNTFDTYDMTDPSAPALIAEGAGSKNWADFAVNGGGIGVGLNTPRTIGQMPPPIDVYDTSDPLIPDNPLGVFDLEGGGVDLEKEYGIEVEFYNGFAYISTYRGLKVFNILDTDLAGVAPTATYKANFPLDPGEVIEGQSCWLSVLAEDDVQVRNVEFFVDGERVMVDGSYPWHYRFAAPRFADQSSMTLQARISDTGGNFILSELFELQVIQDTEPPMIALGDIYENELFTVDDDNLEFTASSSDNVGVRSVAFTLSGNDAPIVEAIDERYSIALPDAPGNYTLVGTATDAAGNSTSTPPITFEVIANPLGSTITATIDAPGDSDEYAFDLAEEGFYLFRYADPAGNLATLQMNSSVGGGVDNNMVEFARTYPAGPESLLLSEFEGQGSGDYFFYSENLSNPVTSAAVSLGQVEALSLAEAAQALVLTLDVQSQGRFDISVLDLANGPVRPLLRLLSPGGDSLTLSLSGDELVATSSLPADLNETGTWTIVVTDMQGLSTGDLAFYMQSLTDPTGSTTLTLGQTAPGTISSSLDAVTFQFAAQAGQTIDLQATYDTGALDLQYTVYDPAGNYVREIQSDALESISITTTGDHTIIVRSNSGRQTGSFELTAMLNGG